MLIDEVKKARGNPKFQQLEIEAKELADRLDAVLLQASKDFPLEEGRMWCLNKAGKLVPFSYNSLIGDS